VGIMNTQNGTYADVVAYFNGIANGTDLHFLYPQYV
jgi:hypothetical protein